MKNNKMVFNSATFGFMVDGHLNQPPNKTVSERFIKRITKEEK